MSVQTLTHTLTLWALAHSSHSALQPLRRLFHVSPAVRVQ